MCQMSKTECHLYSLCLQLAVVHLAGPFEPVVQISLASVRDPDGDVRIFPRPEDRGICSGAKLPWIVSALSLIHWI